MARYDRAITVFSPDGHLFLVEYPMESIRKGNAAVGVRGTDTIVLGVERSPPPSSRIFGVPSLYQTDPSGKFSALKDNASGGNSNSMWEFLEKNYKETSGQETVKLAIQALVEVAESGGGDIKIAVTTKEHGLHQLEEAEKDAIAAEIEAEKAAAEVAKKASPKET